MTPSQELIEKAAKAMFELHIRQSGIRETGSTLTWETECEEDKAQYRAEARAAIDAIADWLTAPLSNPQPGLTRRTLQAVDKSPPFGGHEP